MVTVTRRFLIYMVITSTSDWESRRTDRQTETRGYKIHACTYVYYFWARSTDWKQRICDPLLKKRKKIYFRLGCSWLANSLRSLPYIRTCVPVPASMVCQQENMYIVRTGQLIKASLGSSTILESEFFSPFAHLRFQFRNNSSLSWEMIVVIRVCFLRDGACRGADRVKGEACMYVYCVPMYARALSRGILCER